MVLFVMYYTWPMSVKDLAMFCTWWWKQINSFDYSSLMILCSSGTWFKECWFSALITNWLALKLKSTACSRLRGFQNVPSLVHDKYLQFEVYNFLSIILKGGFRLIVTSWYFGSFLYSKICLQTKNWHFNQAEHDNIKLCMPVWYWPLASAAAKVFRVDKTDINQ